MYIKSYFSVRKRYFRYDDEQAFVRGPSSTLQETDAEEYVSSDVYNVTVTPVQSKRLI